MKMTLFLLYKYIHFQFLRWFTSSLSLYKNEACISYQHFGLFYNATSVVVATAYMGFVENPS
jgi:hypothetical protein